MGELENGEIGTQEGGVPAKQGSVAGCLFMLVLIVAFFGIVGSGCSAFIRDSFAEVPDVSQKTYAEAKATLADAGFTDIEVSEAHGKSGDWVTDSDIVTGTDPEAGSSHLKDSELAVTVSSRAAELEQALSEGVGQDVTVIWPKFAEFGYAPSFIQDDSNQDITQIVTEDAADPGHEGAVSWVLTALKSIDPNAKTVKLGVQSRDVLEAQQQAKETQAQLESKLPLSSAWTYMEQAFQQQYPYGFKLHTVIGVISQTVVDSNTWRLSAYCDVTNAYGMKMKNRVATADVLVIDGGYRVTNMSVR